MFQFPRLPPTEVGSRPSPAGFPHSGTPGSKAACASPGNIAACRALRRPPVPRHPPRALRYHALPPRGARALTSAARSCRCGRRNPTNSSISLSRRYAAIEGESLSSPRGAPARAWARPISAARLRASRPLHLPPINQVFSLGPYQKGGPVSGRASRLDAFSAYPARARLPGCADGRRPVHRRPVRPGPLVLGAAPLSPPAPAEDRDRTVSRRSEPSSRTALIGEQPNPWDLLQPQDAMGRHRGAKPSRRCGLLGKISLLSPEYLLSVERRPSHAGPPDH